MHNEKESKINLGRVHSFIKYLGNNCHGPGSAFGVEGRKIWSLEFKAVRSRNCLKEGEAYCSGGLMLRGTRVWTAVLLGSTDMRVVLETGTWAKAQPEAVPSHPAARCCACRHSCTYSVTTPVPQIRRAHV